MSTIIDLMLAIRKNTLIFYHKDTNCFDYKPYSELEWKKISPDKRIPRNERNTVVLPSYEKIDHKDIMNFYVKEFVEDKAVQKELFDILRRQEYMDAYLDTLHELNIYDDFVDACGDIYVQIFEEWASENGLDFTKTQ